MTVPPEMRVEWEAEARRVTSGRGLALLDGPLARELIAAALQAAYLAGVAAGREAAAKLERHAALARATAAEGALRKVRAHTGHFPDAPRDLLVGLLASIARIVDATLRASEVATTPPDEATSEPHALPVPASSGRVETPLGHGGSTTTTPPDEARGEAKS